MSKLVAESGNPACRYLARHYNTLEKVRATLRRRFELVRLRCLSGLYFAQLRYRFRTKSSWCCFAGCRVYFFVHAFDVIDGAASKFSIAR
jgi:hypothetical protein